MPHISFTRKLANDSRDPYRLSIPKVLAEFLGLAPDGGLVNIEVSDAGGPRLIITRKEE